jgi:hypothetical protein
MILIGLVIIVAVTMVLALPRIWRKLTVPGAPRIGVSSVPRTAGTGDIMNVPNSRDLDTADRLALARLDDDGAPAAVTSMISHGSAKTAGIPSGAADGAPSAIPVKPPSSASQL